MHEQERRRKEAERQDRCERWLTGKLAGQTYTSLAALTSAAEWITMTHYDRPLRDDERVVVRQACVALMAGLVDRQYFSGRILVQRGESVTFLKAG